MGTEQEETSTSRVRGEYVAPQLRHIGANQAANSKMSAAPGEGTDAFGSYNLS